MRGVGVAPVDAARRDDADRRRRALAASRICTGEVCVRSSRPSPKVERVVHRPRRMVLRDVERLEVVEVVLDLGPVGDVEAGARKISSMRRARARDRMQAAAALAAARQRHVDASAASCAASCAPRAASRRASSAVVRALLRVVDRFARRRAALPAAACRAP